MAILVARGVPLQRARLTVLAAERYTVGFVLEEQAPSLKRTGDLSMWGSCAGGCLQRRGQSSSISSLAALSMICFRTVCG